MGYTEKFSGEYAYVTQKGMSSITRHPLFVTWRMMNVRCYDTRHKAYHRYGGRGVGVDPVWRWDNPCGFLNFSLNVGVRPEGTTLDRINNDEGYSPSNIKWSTKREQQNNLSVRTDKELPIGVHEAQGRLEVVITLNNVVKIIGLFPLDKAEEAGKRYKEVRDIKLSDGDDAAMVYVESLDERTPTMKRLRSSKTSRYFGVSWDKSRQKWAAMVSYRETEDGILINKSLGRHDSEDAAYEAVLKFLDFIKEKGYFKKLANKEYMS